MGFFFPILVLVVPKCIRAGNKIIASEHIHKSRINKQKYTLNLPCITSSLQRQIRWLNRSEDWFYGGRHWQRIPWKEGNKHNVLHIKKTKWYLYWCKILTSAFKLTLAFGRSTFFLFGSLFLHTWHDWDIFLKQKAVGVKLKWHFEKRL